MKVDCIDYVPYVSDSGGKDDVVINNDIGLQSVKNL